MKMILILKPKKNIAKWNPIKIELKSKKTDSKRKVVQTKMCWF